jgi:hypothetical protein
MLVSRLFSVRELQMSISLTPLFPIHTRGVRPNPCISHTYEKGGGWGVKVNNNFPEDGLSGTDIPVCGLAPRKSKSHRQECLCH